MSEYYKHDLEEELEDAALALDRACGALSRSVECAGGLNLPLNKAILHTMYQTLEVMYDRLAAIRFEVEGLTDANEGL